MLIQSLLHKKEKLAVIGLGYVGLPIALAFAKKLAVIGFDINEDHIHSLQKGIDPSNEIATKSFENCDIIFSNQIEVLHQASFFIVAVPTPVNEYNIPDLTALMQASNMVGSIIKKGNYVVFESTVYPGCTEEDCIPVIEKNSGLKFITDFKVGYSPERINPGDKEHTLEKVVKVVAGCDDESLSTIASVYSIIVEPGIYKASSIKVAEAAKVIENTQRDLNIGLMNELSIIFDKMNINTYEVLEAASTKWNFLKFNPGLVGGHCIGVDPYYLTYKANELGYASKIITAGRMINDDMGKYVAEKVLKYLLAFADNVPSIKVLVLGVTFKENVSDIRNSKVIDVINTLRDFHITVHLADAYANTHELQKEYGLSLTENLNNDYNAVVIAVPHKAYLTFDDDYFQSITKSNALIADLKGIYRNKIYSRKYWSL
jgi:UDP-N-acetyl-D-galactosamine dehydrogenase